MKGVKAAITGLAIVLLCAGGTVTAGAQTAVTQEEEAVQVPVYTETLKDLTVGSGEAISYTTISSEFAGGQPVEGYYPGELTVEISGEVVVESGGMLSIGTLSIGGNEAAPVLSFQNGGRIVVKAGGRLKLTGVEFQNVGEEPVILQEYGASVALQCTPAEEGWIVWSSPVVNNLNTRPDDLWIEAGRPLTENLLPDSMKVELETEGIAQEQELKIRWDFSDYTGQTDGDCTIKGAFLASSGEELPSLCPLEVNIHWYTPQELVVTDAVWKGDALATVQLTVKELPEDAEVWGEVSVDDGKTWERWDDPDAFFILPVDGKEEYACIFSFEDKTPRLFRIVAQDPWEMRFWSSKAVALAPEEEEDSGGNRGGTTTPTTPDREPTLPAPTPSPTPAAPQVPEQTQLQEENSVQKEPEPTGSPAPQSEEGQSDSGLSGKTEETVQQTAAPAQKDFFPAAQLLLVAAGAVVCGVLAMVLTRVAPFKRKR